MQYLLETYRSIVITFTVMQQVFLMSLYLIVLLEYASEVANYPMIVLLPVRRLTDLNCADNVTLLSGDTGILQHSHTCLT